MFVIRQHISDLGQLVLQLSVRVELSREEHHYISRSERTGTPLHQRAAATQRHVLKIPKASQMDLLTHLQDLLNGRDRGGRSDICDNEDTE